MDSEESSKNGKAFSSVLVKRILHKFSINLPLREKERGNPHGDEHLLPSNLITVGVPKQEQQKILKVFVY